MAVSDKHSWTFKTRFRSRAFGWKSQPASVRIREAVSEIKLVARRDQVLAAEGAIALIERLSPALQQVDSSSGSIGSAVNAALAQLVPLISNAAVDAAQRGTWLERLWDAYQSDDIPYIESLADHWGALCASPELASHWADQLAPNVRLVWSAEGKSRGYFRGTVPCLSALLAARRYDELLSLVALAPYSMWHYRQYAVRALAAQGKKAEALRYAEEERGLNDSALEIARTCEEILLSCGLADEAYRRYGLVASQGGTYLATFRAVIKKYPHKPAAKILADLVASMPGEQGKWFAAAKDAGLYDDALALARATPCDPRTLTRAARDYAEKQPEFAVGAGLLALYWLAQGHGYEVTGLDVLTAYRCTIAAATKLGTTDEVRERIRGLVNGGPGAGLVYKVLARELG